jgi:UDP-N-acetyl-D-glucosamine dehydrogenase
MGVARAGIGATGVDIDERKISALQKGESYIGDVPSAEVKIATDAGLFHATTDFGALREAEGISICVPTPLGKSREPDVSFVVAAAEQLAGVLVRGQTVILESTVYPGATEELVAPILERNGMRAGSDFYLAFSPERIDPGNKRHPLAEIPKVVGGINEESGDKAARIYRKVFRDVVQVNTTREAEMAKLLENTFRAVNIGLVNELAVMAHGMGIDIWKVIDAAATKPFGFMPFYPGPGWGGHCIPVDPFYLTWRARMDGLESGFIDRAGTVNAGMPRYVVQRVGKLLNQRGRSVNHSKVLLLGLAYKRDVGDMRESPAVEIAELLTKDGADLTYHDPHVETLSEHGMALRSSSLTVGLLGAQDCVVITTDHSTVDYRFVRDNSRLVFDTRNVIGRLGLDAPNVVKL